VVLSGPSVPCDQLDREAGTGARRRGVLHRYLALCTIGLEASIFLKFLSLLCNRYKVFRTPYGPFLRHHLCRVHFFYLSTTPRGCIGGVEIQPHAFLTSALDGGEWSASYPGRFTPRERDRSTHWIGD
jgi:hypothetical protein